jgi:hypothetical protein
MANEKSTVEYRDIQGFPGYRVGADSSVWSRWRIGCKRGLGKKWHRLKGSPDSSGYPSVKLKRNGASYAKRIHILMLEAFVGPCPTGMECRHLDDNKLNNALDNLKWGTRSENMRDAIANNKRPRGEDYFNAILTEKKVHKIMEMRRAGCTYRKIQSAIGGPVNTIVAVCRGRTWKHVTRLTLCRPSISPKP